MSARVLRAGIELVHSPRRLGAWLLVVVQLASGARRCLCQQATLLIPLVARGTRVPPPITTCRSRTRTQTTCTKPSKSAMLTLTSFWYVQLHTCGGRRDGSIAPSLRCSRVASHVRRVHPRRCPAFLLLSAGVAVHVSEVLALPCSPTPPPLPLPRVWFQRVLALLACWSARSATNIQRTLRRPFAHGREAPNQHTSSLKITFSTQTLISGTSI